MAGPLFAGVGARMATTSAAAVAPAKPSVAGPNMILLAVVTSANNDTHATATPGWALIGQIHSGPSFTASLWSAAGNAAAPTFTWASAAAGQAQIACYADPQGLTEAMAGATTAGNGLASPHATGAILTTRANSLAVYVDVAAVNIALATPAGWTQDASTGGTSGNLVFGSKAIAAAGASTGAISVAGAASAWVQWQVEIMEKQPAPGFQVSKAEVGVWYEPPVGVAFTKVEMGAWLDYVGTPPPSGRRRRMAVVN